MQANETKRTQEIDHFPEYFSIISANISWCLASFAVPSGSYARYCILYRAYLYAVIVHITALDAIPRMNDGIFIPAFHTRLTFKCTSFFRFS